MTAASATNRSQTPVRDDDTSPLTPGGNPSPAPSAAFHSPAWTIWKHTPNLTTRKEPQQQKPHRTQRQHRRRRCVTSCSCSSTSCPPALNRGSSWWWREMWRISTLCQLRTRRSASSPRRGRRRNRPTPDSLSSPRRQEMCRTWLWSLRAAWWTRAPRFRLSVCWRARWRTSLSRCTSSLWAKRRSSTYRPITVPRSPFR